MSWGVSPWVYPVWDALDFLDLGHYFLPHFREFFNHYLLKYFLIVLFLSDSSGTPMIRMLGRFTLSQRSLRLPSFLLILLFFFPLYFIYFYHFIFYLTYLSSPSVILLLVPSRVFLISFITLFIFN